MDDMREGDDETTDLSDIGTGEETCAAILRIIGGGQIFNVKRKGPTDGPTSPDSIGKTE